MLCFDLPSAPWVLPDGQEVAGLTERAARLGYRSCAAASGTTANMLQMAELLGFSHHELGMMRLTMAAWMLPTDDHSLFEILLGAEPHMEPSLRMAMGLRDLEQLWPRHTPLTTADGMHTFAPASFWSRVRPRLESPSGRPLLDAMAPTARAYVRDLIAAADDGGAHADGQARANDGGAADGVQVASAAEPHARAEADARAKAHDEVAAEAWSHAA